MPTFDEIVKALQQASQGVDFSTLYAQNPQLPALTPQHSPFWFWNAANEQGTGLIGKVLSGLGYQPQSFDYLAKMKQEYPQLIHPDRQMPFFKVGDYELNPARWLDYMKQGSYAQLANELLGPQQPAAQQAMGLPAAQPVSYGSYEDVVPYFQQMLGGWTPEDRAKLLPLVQSLYDYFRGQG